MLAACRAAVDGGRLAEDDLRDAHAGLGLAGARQPGDRERMLAQPHPFASLVVETDAYAAWLGAFGGGDGAILIVGTGSCGLAVVERRAVQCRRLGPRDRRRGSGR